MEKQRMSAGSRKVRKMTRDGLVEKDLAEHSSVNISRRAGEMKLSRSRKPDGNGQDLTTRPAGGRHPGKGKGNSPRGPTGEKQDIRAGKQRRTIQEGEVHSARWPEKMFKQFCFDEKKQTGRRNLLRTCGYGIPNLNRAIQCLNNSVNMIIQGELQPFKKENNRCAMKEMDLYTLPWPKKVLIEMGDTEAELRITLSYFIEPGPGEIGWKDKYRYQSCGLRFDVRNSNETEEDFKKRINIKVRGEDKQDKGDGSSGSERWFLGSKLRDVGSIHSDYMQLSGVELSDINQIAVYPVIGWWRERAYLNKYNSKIRYALIVSISTPRQDIDLYTPIITQIKNKVEVPIAVS